MGVRSTYSNSRANGKGEIMAEIVISGNVSSLPFHSPALGDKRDNELAMERLNEKIRGSVTQITTLDTSLTSLTATVGTNTTNIATNTTNIATNTTNISTNTSSISTINTTLATKVDESSSLTDVSVTNGSYTATVSGSGFSSTWLSTSNWNNTSWSTFFNAEFDKIETDIADLQSKINEICAIIRG